MSNIRKMLDQQQFIYNWLIEQPAKLRQRQLSHQLAEPSLRRVQSELDKYWEEFNKCDEFLREALPATDNYIVENVFEMAQKLREEIMSQIASIRASESADSDGAYGGTVKPMEKKLVKKKQLVLQQGSDEEQEVLRARPEQQSNMDMKFMLEQMSAQMKSLTEKVMEMDNNRKAEEKATLCPPKDLPGPSGVQQATIVNQPDQLNDGFKIFAEELKKISEGGQKNITPRIKKNIPKFYGELQNYGTWKVLFTRIVDTLTTSPAIKMEYLKEALADRNERGDKAPRLLIEYLHITDDSYRHAFEILERRYNHPVKMALDQIDEMFNLKRKSADAEGHLRLVMDTFERVTANVKNIVIAEQFPNTTTENMAALEETPEMQSAFMNVVWGRALSRNFDSTTEEAFKIHQTCNGINNRSIPTLQAIKEFVYRRIADEATTVNKKSDKQQAYVQQQAKVHVQQTAKESCMYCKKNGHILTRCRNFINMKIEDRVRSARELKLCFKCAVSNWKYCKCAENKSLPYHKLLQYPKSNAQRYDGPKNQVIQKSTYKEASKEAKINVVNEDKKTKKIVLLPTALVRVKSNDGKWIVMRALIDQGATHSIITSRAATLLNLKQKHTAVCIKGVGNTSAAKNACMVYLNTKPHFESNFKLKFEALVMKSITGMLPNNPVKELPVQEQNLADPEYSQPGAIDILISGGEYPKIFGEGVHSLNVLPQKITPEGVLIQESNFGTIISGPRQQEQATIHVSLNEQNPINMRDVHRFWDVEDPEIDEDVEVEEFYVKTTKRNEDGSYTVRIPFKKEKELGLSRPRALARWLQLVKKLASKPALRIKYNETLEEYLTLGHMTLADHHHPTKYYMPHQAVIKEESTTTPVRVVFDASARTSNNRSFNDVQYIGPKLQQDLTMLILRFRQKQIAVVADITKMYRQIKIHKDDIPYHRILWSRNDQDQIKEYELNTVTFGTAAAPYLAIRTLLQLAEDEETNHPIGAQLVKNNFYVDDLIANFDSVEEAKEAIESINKLTRAGKFELRKWASNNLEAIINIQQEDRLNKNEVNLSDEKLGAIKALGVKWNPSTDELCINIKVPCPDNSLTKRKALSITAQVFDPIGILAPVTVSLKMLIQEIWRHKLDWDDDVPADINERWQRLQSQIHVLQDVKVPRWIGEQTESPNALIGFADASKEAYGAVIYQRTGNKLVLVAAKSKVAPIKHPLTIPRLELAAAVTLAKLMNTVMTALQYNPDTLEILAYSDSEITLAWIKNSDDRWKAYVQARVNIIKSLIPAKHWHHIGTKLNPADHVSRGLNPTELIQCQLWWNGPTSLPVIKERSYETDLEEKIKSATINVTTTEASFLQTEIIDKISSWSRIARVTAWCLRAISLTKPKRQALTIREIQKAEIMVLLAVQKDNFSEEIKSLAKKEPIKKGPLAAYAPVLEESTGLLRIGGRIDNAKVPYNQRHPIIIPKVCKDAETLTAKMIEWAHRQTLHGGNDLVATFLRQKYHIIGMRNSIKHVLHRCMTCRRYKGRSMTQQMGNLPAERVTMAHPFSHCAVDYAGPITLRASKIRGGKTLKGYIAVFVCLTTKAYHLEAVSDLTGEAFVAAFRRFVGRRGLVEVVRSDNGTNFVLGRKLIEADIRKAIKNGQDAVIDEFKDKNLTWITEDARPEIDWKFMPPRAPHFGGLHEAAVKSVKNHLKKIIGSSLLTYEGLATVLVQIEAQLNSRPLLLNPTTAQVLTPGHFLIGHQLNMLPEPDLSEISITNRYKTQQKMQQDFWKRWNSEYLNELQQRKKWKTQMPNIQPGQIVLLKDENAPPATWPKGVVVNTIPGKDGLIRVVEVRDAKGSIIKRPLSKIVMLSTEELTNIAPPPGTSGDVRRSTRVKKKVLCNVSDWSDDWSDEATEQGETMEHPPEERFNIMPTVLFRIIDGANREIWVKALWDSGASHSVITHSLRDKLHVTDSTRISTKTSGFVRQQISDQIKVNYKTHSDETIHMGVLKVLDNPGPIMFYPHAPIVKVPSKTILADPLYYMPTDIHMVLGIDWISKTKIRGEEERVRGFPHATQTIFGELWEGLLDVNYMENKGLKTDTMIHFFPRAPGCLQFQLANSHKITIDTDLFKGIETGDATEWDEKHPLNRSRLEIQQLTKDVDLLRARLYDEIDKKETEKKRRKRTTSIFSSVLLAVVIIGGFFIKSGSALNITALKGPGFLISHDKTLLLQTGQFDFRMNTNVNITQDVQIIHQIINSMKVFCEYLGTREFPRHECHNYAHHIDNQGIKLINELRFQKNHRSKRSDGLIMWLVHLIVGTGSQEQDDEASKTTARKTTKLVEHALQNFKLVEGQIVARENLLQTNLKKLGDQLNKITKGDSSAIRLLELTHYLQGQEILTLMSNKYHELITGPVWTSTELELFNNITTQIPTGHMMPSVTLANLMDTSKRVLHEIEDCLTIDYVFPIVSTDIYEEFQVLAIPDLVRQEIAVTEEKVAINHNKDLFFLSSQIKQRLSLNISWDIVDVRRTYDISESNNCAVQHAVNTIKRVPCLTTTLPADYDEWKQLPNQHQYMFYTSHMDDTYLQCEKKERFTRSMGIITVPSGCIIKAKSGMIYGSTDKTAVVKHQYAIRVPINETLDENRTTNIKLENMVNVTDSTDLVLQEAAQNIAEMETSSLWMWISIGLGNVLVVAMATIIGVCIYRRLVRINNQEIPQQKDIEMSNINKGKPINHQSTPTPAPRVWIRYNNE